MTNIIDKIRVAHGYTKKELAERSGLSYDRVKRLCHLGTPPSPNDCNQLFHPFGGYISSGLLRQIASMEVEEYRKMMEWNDGIECETCAKIGDKE